MQESFSTIHSSICMNRILEHDTEADDGVSLGGDVAITVGGA